MDKVPGVPDREYTFASRPVCTHLHTYRTEGTSLLNPGVYQGMVGGWFLWLFCSTVIEHTCYYHTDLVKTVPDHHEHNPYLP